MSTKLKAATSELILTAKNEVKKNFRNALMCARFDETTRRVYPCRWMKGNRGFACSDKTATILVVLKAQGYKFTQGNDAPRCGLEGNYIQLSKVSFNFLKHYRQW